MFAFTSGNPNYEKSEAILKFCETVLERIQENFFPTSIFASIFQVTSTISRSL